MHVMMYMIVASILHNSLLADIWGCHVESRETWTRLPFRTIQPLSTYQSRLEQTDYLLQHSCRARTQSRTSAVSARGLHLDMVLGYFGFGHIIYVSLLFTNAIAILNEERFLAKSEHIRADHTRTGSTSSYANMFSRLVYPHAPERQCWLRKRSSQP